MTWSHVTKMMKIKTRVGLMDRLQWRRASQGFEATDHKVVKLGQDLAPMDRGNGEERARSRSMDQRVHVMIWSGSYHSCVYNASIALVHWKMEMKWKCARQRYNLRAFHFTGPRLSREVLDRI